MFELCLLNTKWKQIVLISKALLLKIIEQNYYDNLRNKYCNN